MRLFDLGATGGPTAEIMTGSMTEVFGGFCRITKPGVEPRLDDERLAGSGGYTGVGIDVWTGDIDVADPDGSIAKRLAAASELFSTEGAVLTVQVWCCTAHTARETDCGIPLAWELGEALETVYVTTREEAAEWVQAQIAKYTLFDADV